jgi:hypothetical protein
MRKLKPATSDNLLDVASAFHYLIRARDLLKAAGCESATDYVRRALKSAEGAQRHARRRLHEAEGRANG